MFNLVNINIPINVQVAPSVQTGLNIAVLSPGAAQTISQANQTYGSFLNLQLS